MTSRIVESAYDELEAALDKVANLSCDSLTPAEVLALLARRERIVSTLPTIDHALISQLRAEAVPTAVGAASWPDALMTTLRTSKNEARRRLASADALGPRRAFTALDRRRRNGRRRADLRLWTRQPAGREGRVEHADP